MSSFSILQIRRPRFRLPPGSCDTLCHAGPPKEFLSALHARLGIERAVLVQTDGDSDYHALLNAIAHDPYRRRGIVRHSQTLASANLDALHRGGVRGVELTFADHGEAPFDPVLFEAAIERVRHLRWHVELRLRLADIAPLAPMLRKLSLPFVVDAVDMQAGAGSDGTHFTALLELAKAPACWMRIAGLGNGAWTPHDRLIKALRAVVEASPDRVVWGSGFPSVDIGTDPTDRVDQVPWCAITEALRRKLLVDNPARLYGFASSVDAETAPRRKSLAVHSA